MSLCLPVTTPVNDCWNRIGVNGDRTCPELEEHVHCRNCPVFAAAARGFFDRRAPEGYLAEWAELLGRPAEVGPGDDSALLVFRLGVEWLAMALSAVAEVTTLRPVHRVPHRTNRVFSGLVEPPGAVAPLRLAPRPARRRRRPTRREAAGEPPAGRDPQGRRDLGRSRPRRSSGVQRVARDRLQKVPSTLSNPAGSFSRAVFAWGQGRSVDVLDEPRVFEALRRLGG